MPNITISGLAPATLPLDGANSFFEVQTFEAGVAVSRKIASDDLQIQGSIVVQDEGVPLVTGADTLDFVGSGVQATGAGSTKTITIPGGGQVDSVVGGVNITVDATDPVNPIVNLDALGLDDLTDVDLTGAADNDLLFRSGGNWIDTAGILGFDGVGFLGIDVTTTGVSGFEVDTADPNSRSYIAVWNNDTSQYLEMSAIGSTIGDNLRFQFSTTTSPLDFLGDNGVHLQLNDSAGFVPQTDIPAGAAFRLGEKAAAETSEAGFGQLWVRDDAPNVLVFTDDTGVDTVLGAGGGGIGGSIAINQIAVGSGVDTIGGSADLTIDGNFFSIANLSSGILLRDGAFFRMASPADTEFATFLMDVSNVFRLLGTGVSEWHIQDGIELRVYDSGDTDYMSILHDGDWLNFGAFQTTGFKFSDVPIYLEARGAAAADETDYGQIWVEAGAAGDPLWAEVELLADFEGPDAATSYTEISTNAASATFQGNAELDTAQFQSGSSSLLLDGTGDDVTFPDIAAYDFGTGDWTVEGWMRFNTLPPLQTSAGPGYVQVDFRNSGSAILQYGIIEDAFGYRVRLVGDGFTEVGTIGGGIAINTWYHWAMTRTGGNVRAYFNGNYEVGDFGAAPANMGGPDVAVIIGSRDSSDAYHDGWIDNVRWTYGTARYTGTGTYTIPTTPYLTAPGSQNLFFDDENGISTNLLTGAASSLQATMAVGNTTSIDLEIITGAALTIFDAADVDSVSVEINTTTMAPAEALVFTATANVEVYSFDEGINIDGGDLNLGTGDVNFYRFGDAISSSLGPDGTDIRMQVVGGTSTFFVQADSIRLSEASTPAPNIAGRGQIWVRDDVPNNLAFTDDADEDFGVAYATGRETANATHDFNTAGNIAENFIGFYDDGNPYTVTLEDSTSVVNWPIHTAIQVLAPGVGAITVAEGSGTTLFLDDGTDTVGGGTLTQGVVTIYRTSTTDYYIWGSGFTP